MSKFLEIDHRFINTNSIVNVVVTEERTNFSFQLLDGKSFTKFCKDKAEFQKTYDLLLKELDVVTLN